MYPLACLLVWFFGGVRLLKRAGLALVVRLIKFLVCLWVFLVGISKEAHGQAGGSDHARAPRRSQVGGDRWSVRVPYPNRGHFKSICRIM